MLDIQFIRENADLVQTKSRQKGYNVDVAKLLELDEERRELIQKVTGLQTSRNALAQAAKGQRPSEAQIEEGRALKEEAAILEERLKIVDDLYAELLRAVPNMPTDDVPIGTSEDDNKITKVVGESKDYDFTPKHEYQLAEPRGFIDKERAAKIAGSRFAY
jgi:seryl-tRNA synthetase